MYRVPRYKVSLVREGSIPAEIKTLSSPCMAEPVLRDYLEGADREHFVVAMLDNKNKLIGITTISIGSLNASIVHPREIFKPAILCNAASIILSHNHPSGDPRPSQEDLSITDRLKKAGEIIGIPVTDHIILGDNIFSFLEHGCF